MISKICYKLGVWIINKKVFNNYDFLIKNQYAEIHAIQKYQLQKLKELVETAYNDSQYYKEVFDHIGLHPDDIQSLSDLKKISVLTKQELLSNAEKIQVSNFPGLLVKGCVIL